MRTYIAERGLFLLLTLMICANAQPDTVVLNRTEFRFPETHPGKVFVVSKVLVNGQQSLKKDAAEVDAQAPRSPSRPALRQSAGRDPLGRTLKTGEYASRLARIQKAHKLPTLSLRSVGKEEDRLQEASEHRDFIGEGTRYALTSDSPLIQSAKDLVRMEKAERDAVRQKYGALGRGFSARINALKETDSLDILIELEIEHPGFVHPQATHEERVANGRAWAYGKPKISPADFLRQHGLKDIAPEGAPRRKTRLARARASKSQIRRLATAPHVVSVTLNPKLETTSGPVYTDFVVSGQNYPVDMQESSGIGVATIEMGLGHAFVNRIASNLRPVAYDEYTYSSYPAERSSHSEGVYQLLAAAAPDHNKFHYHAYTFESIEQEIFDNVIVSLGNAWKHGWDNTTDPDSRAVDRMAYTYPSPLFSLSAGNDGNAYEPGGQAYNAINVANVQHRDSSHYQVDMEFGVYDTTLGFYIKMLGSQTRNPPAKYGSYRDWELPTLVAPGMTPNPWLGICFPDVWINSTGSKWCAGGGTSFSVPVTTGLAAQVIGAQSTYATTERLTETKAALMVTAENVDSGYWAPQTQDSRDGVGTISGANAVEFVTNATNANNELGPHMRAYKSGSLFEYDFDSNVVIEESFLVPASLPAGKHLRIVLTWTSSPGVNWFENQISDLALFAHTNSGWKWSETWNSNSEVIDIPNASLTPNGSYSIRVYPQVYRAATDGPTWLSYTLAWNWVKDHAD